MPGASKKDWTCSGWASAQSWAAERRAVYLQMLFLESTHSTCSKLEMASGFAQAQILHAASEYSDPILLPSVSYQSVSLSVQGRLALWAGRRQALPLLLQARAEPAFCSCPL